MRRFFTEPENIKGSTAYIYEDASHITRVLRMKPNDEILIFDGTGCEYTARLAEISDKCCTAVVTSSSLSVQEPLIKTSIFQALPKSGKMEDIIQKSVELGVFNIIPTATERCVTKLCGDKRQSEKLKRWNKVSVSAAKQCGRGILPEVCSPVSFKSAVDSLKSDYDLALMPYEMLGHDGVSNLKDTLTDFKANALKKADDESGGIGNIKIGILIGPEGGFSDSEAAYAKNCGLSLVGLGNRILRTETVSSAMLAMLMYELDQL